MITVVKNLPANARDMRDMDLIPGSEDLLEFAQVHVHGISDAIQPSLMPSSPSALNLSQHQGLVQ